jgi:ubiquitin fusion degradation protein 1
MFNTFMNAMSGHLPQVQVPPFNETYRCYPVAMKNKESLEETDKMILPASALSHLARLEVTYPMTFRCIHPVTKLAYHCGVEEFDAQEGTAYVPFWVMQNLGIEVGATINITNVTLKKGTFVQIQPHRTAFTELSNPRIVLEHTLSSFRCLTKNSTIRLKHAGEVFLLDIVDLKPANACSIYETDLDVDFAPPKDYVEPDYKAQKAAKAAASSSSSSSSSSAVPSSSTTASFSPSPSSSSTASGDGGYFASLGNGNSLNGKRVRKSSTRSPSAKPNKESKHAPASQSQAAPAIAEGSTRTDSAGNSIKRQGNFDYVYGKDGRLVRRIPVRRNLGGSSQRSGSTAQASSSSSSSYFSAFKGKGHSLK